MAVSAVAAVAGVVIALAAYAIPRAASIPHALPTPGSSRASPPYTTPPQQTTTPASSGPTLAPPSGPPAGCRPGKAAVARYQELAGPSWYSKADAAQQADSELQTALDSGASGAIWSDLDALYLDFGNLHDIALEQEGPYNTVFTQTQKDDQTLNADCNTG